MWQLWQYDLYTLWKRNYPKLFRCCYDIYTKAKEQTDSYNDCKANVLADFICDLVTINDDWYPKADFLDNIKHPETFEKSLDTYMKTLDQTTLERYSGDNPDDTRNISTELYNYL